jgi:hypothetical protein
VVRLLFDSKLKNFKYHLSLGTFEIKMLSIIGQQFTGLNLFVKQAGISVRSAVISAGRA